LKEPSGKFDEIFILITGDSGKGRHWMIVLFLLTGISGYNLHPDVMDLFLFAVLPD
jgi:hypothetical protein